MKDILNPKTRQWLYGVAIAVLGILAVKGFIDESMRSALDVFFMALFGIAAGNVDHSDGGGDV